MTHAPILVHYFPLPLPYLPAFRLQQAIHDAQLSQRRRTQSLHRDVLLLLQHRPVYTTGRRQTDDETKDDMTRLAEIGADFISTKRGGETTYHGPGQLVVYPLLDLARHKLSIRDYIEVLQTSLQKHLKEAHNIHHAPSEHTGVFLDANTKIASIGVQVQHRLTMHGLAMNVTKEPKAWFDQVVACGLQDVRAGSIADVSPLGGQVNVPDEAEGMTRILTEQLGCPVEPLQANRNAESKVDDEHDHVQHLRRLIRSAQQQAESMGPWLTSPRLAGS